MRVLSISRGAKQGEDICAASPMASRSKSRGSPREHLLQTAKDHFSNFLLRLQERICIDTHGISSRSPWMTSGRASNLRLSWWPSWVANGCWDFGETHNPIGWPTWISQRRYLRRGVGIYVRGCAAVGGPSKIIFDEACFDPSN